MSYPVNYSCSWLASHLGLILIHVSSLFWVQVRKMQLVSAYRCWMHCLIYKKKKQGEEDLVEVVAAVVVGSVEEVAGVSLMVEMIGLAVGGAAATTTDGETHSIRHQVTCHEQTTNKGCIYNGLKWRNYLTSYSEWRQEHF